MTKADAIIEYFNNYPQLYSWLYLNSVTNSVGNTAMLTDSDNVLREYIDGSKDKEYIFAIAMVKDFDTGTSDINANALGESENLIEWVEENNNNETYPDFGEKCSIEEIEIINNVPQLAIDSENNIARYLISMKINYTERK